MKLCWTCYIIQRKGEEDEWGYIPNIEEKEKCELCKIVGIYVRETNLVVLPLWKQKEREKKLNPKIKKDRGMMDYIKKPRKILKVREELR